MRILVVEDDKVLHHLIAKRLKEEGHSVDDCYDGESGFDYADSMQYDCIILDLMLPKRDGISILRELRNKGNASPVLILTARDSIDDRVVGLDAGADDYITKPFEIPEVLARIQVQLRHAVKEQESDRLTYRDMVLDKTTRQVMIEGTPLPKITKQEFAILELFLRHPRKVFTKQEIFESVWNQEYFVEDKTINVHISNIRAKLKKTATDTYIQTVWGIGFKLAE